MPGTGGGRRQPFFAAVTSLLSPDQVFGIGELARLVDMYSRRLQFQERLTEQISRAVMDSIGALGVGVIIEARHLYMMMRGVEKQNSLLTTSSLLGTFRDNQATRQEFLSLIRRPTVYSG